jgi:hypothetical protein
MNNESKISEFYYYESFRLSDLQDLLDFLNNEQSQHGRIIEMDAEKAHDEYRIFIVRRIKFDASKKSFNVLNICNKKIAHHLKINDCEYALLFDLPTTKRKN